MLFTTPLVVAAAFAAPEVEVRSRAKCYPSGLRVGVIQRPGPPVVGLATVVAGGSSAERDGETGAAHTLEHLWFRSPRQGYASADDWLHAIGAEANAYTTHDETTYLTVAPKRAIRTLLLAEAERLTDPLGEVESVLETEKSVVKAEIAQRYDGRSPWLTSVLGKLLPTEHPYTRTISGSQDQVQALTSDAIQAYAARQYTAEKTTLYIQGAVHPDAVLRIVDQSFGEELLGGPPTDCTATDDKAEEPLPMARGADWSVEEAGVDAPVEMVAWTIPSGFDVRDRAQMAAQMMQWQLNKATRLDADCLVVPLRQLGVVACVAEPGNRGGQDTWKPGLKAIDRLWKQVHDIHDSKSHYWRQVANALADEAELRVARSAEVLHAGGGHLEDKAIEFHRSGGAHVDARVSSQEAADFALRWLTPERMQGLTLNPAAAQRASASRYHGTRATSHQPPTDPGEVDEQRLKDLVVDPGLGQLDAREISGRQVWLLPREGLHRVLVSSVFPGDSGWADSARRQRAWDLLEDPWDMMSDEDQNVAWNSKVRPSMFHGEGYWAFEASGHRVDPTVRTLRRAAPPPAKLIPKSEDKEALQGLLDWRTDALTEPGVQAALLRWTALSDGLAHPTLDPRGIQSLRSISRKDARAFAATYLHPRRARLVAVVPPDKLGSTHKAIQQYFGVADELEEAPPDSTPPLRQARPRSIAVLDRPAGSQATVTAECHLGDGDGVVLWVLRAALERDLNDALRNDLGVTYGVHPSTAYEGHGLTLRIATQVPHDAVGTAVASILGSIDQAAAGELDEATLNRFKLELARGTALRWQSPEELLGLLQYAAAHGYEPGTLDIAERLARVDRQVIQERLAPCTGHEAITVVGGADAVSESLDGAELDHTRHP